MCRISKRVFVWRIGLVFVSAERSWAQVKMPVLIVLIMAVSSGLFAQEIELPPMVVTGTFELRQGPSLTDLFTLHLQRQIERKDAVEEIMARSPWYYSRFWSYVPISLGSSQNDSAQFFMPNYLSADYRNTERTLIESRKQ